MRNAGSPGMRQTDQRLNGSKLAGKAQLDVGVPGSKEPDRPRQAACEVFERNRIGVAGTFVGRAFGASRSRSRGHSALAEVCGQSAQDLIDIGVDARDRRPGERTGEVAVLAVCRASLRQVEAPISGRRYRLQAPPGLRGDDHGKGRLGLRVIRSRIGAIDKAHEPITAELDDIRPACGSASCDLAAGRGMRQLSVSAAPALASKFAERRLCALHWAGSSTPTQTNASAVPFK